MAIVNLKDILCEGFDKLPPEKQEEVIDFVDYLNNQQDTTKYLFSSKKNKEYLESAIDDVESGSNLVEVDLQDLKDGKFPQI